jgi:hypothetical protein
MMTWIYVLLAMLAAGLAGMVAHLPLAVIERRILWRGRNQDEWKAMGVESPGDRLPIVTMAFSAISTILSRGSAYIAGTLVFIERGKHPLLIPMILFALLCLPNDILRIKKFSGNAGQYAEVGYFCGGIVGFVLFLWIRSRMI